MALLMQFHPFVDFEYPSFTWADGDKAKSDWMLEQQTDFAASRSWLAYHIDLHRKKYQIG